MEAQDDEGPLPWRQPTQGGSQRDVFVDVGHPVVLPRWELRGGRFAAPLAPQPAGVGVGQDLADVPLRVLMPDATPGEVGLRQGSLQEVLC